MRILPPLKTGAMMLVLAMFGRSIPAHALTFDFDFLASSSSAANDAFTQAGYFWSSWLNDDITISMQVGTGTLSPGVLGSTSNTGGYVTYSSFLNRLDGDATSYNDGLAVSSLSSSSSYDLFLNRTSDNPEGAGSATPYLDANDSDNNSYVYLTQANAKALGYTSPQYTSSYDATIIFSESFAWDYDSSDGVSAGAYDFVGMAIHEIGHVLGFVSAADWLDYSPAPGVEGADYFEEDQLAATSLDMFRYSDESADVGVIDISADERDKYFSLDGGETELATFSTGVYYGDGSQASHWEDNLGLGIMDPTIATGEVLSLLIRQIKLANMI